MMLIGSASIPQVPQGRWQAPLGTVGGAVAKEGHAAEVMWELNGKGVEQHNRIGTCELRTGCAGGDIEGIVRTHSRPTDIGVTQLRWTVEMA